MDEELEQMDGLGMVEARPSRSRAVEAPAADDDLDDVTERPAMAVEAFLRGLGPDLLPGAKERLMRQFGPDASEGGLRPLVNHLADPHNCERYMDGERPQPNISPLRQLIRRWEHAGLLQKGGADQLHDELAIDIHPEEMRRDPGRVASRLWDELHADAPERRLLWDERHRPAMGHRQRKVADAIAALGLDFLPGRLEELCFKWKDAADSNRPMDDVIRIVAARLNRDGIPISPKAVGAAIHAANPAPAPDFRAAHARAVGYERL